MSQPQLGDQRVETWPLARHDEGDLRDEFRVERSLITDQLVAQDRERFGAQVDLKRDANYLLDGSNDGVVVVDLMFGLLSMLFGLSSIMTGLLSFVMPSDSN